MSHTTGCDPCKNPEFPDQCLNQGNQLNLALAQNHRRGITFSCPKSFSDLMGYDRKICRVVEHHDDTAAVAQLTEAKSAFDKVVFGKGGVRNFGAFMGYDRKCQSTTFNFPKLGAVSEATPLPTATKGPVTINITFGNKTGHPHQQYITGSEVILVDGRPGAPIRLTVGETYIFNIGSSVEGHQFMITDHPAGGVEAVKCLTPPAADSELTITVGADYPRRMYYQSTKNMYVGGWIITSGYTSDKTLH